MKRVISITTLIARCFPRLARSTYCLPHFFVNCFIEYYFRMQRNYVKLEKAMATLAYFTKREWTVRYLEIDIKKFKQALRQCSRQRVLTIETFIQNKRNEEFVVPRQSSTLSYFYMVHRRGHFHGLKTTLTRSTQKVFGRLRVYKLTRAAEKSIGGVKQHSQFIITMEFYSIHKFKGWDTRSMKSRRNFAAVPPTCQTLERTCRRGDWFYFIDLF